MIGLIQRVKQAQVDIEGQTVGTIGQGILLLLGVEKTDTPAIAQRLAGRVANYRIFSDADGKMNLNLKQVDGQILIVSQFTLVADTKKGNRPGFSRGAPPQLGKELYEQFVVACRGLGLVCQTGQFGADMQVSLVNDGPVTFQLEVN